MYLTEGPGPWQAFLKRPDNTSLSIMEAKQKYLNEQLIFEEQMSYLQLWNTQNTISPTAPGASAAGGPLPSEGPASTPEKEILTEDERAILTEDGTYIVT
jgi:hypothetical protein